MVRSSEPIPIAVMGVLLLFSLLSWTVIFSKLFSFRRAASANKSFLRAFRKADRMDAIAAASQQFTARSAGRGVHSATEKSAAR